MRRVQDSRICHHRLPFLYSFLLVLLILLFLLFLLILEVIQEMLQIDKLIPLQSFEDSGNFFIFKFLVMFVAVLQKVLISQQLYKFLVYIIFLGFIAIIAIRIASDKLSDIKFL